MISALILAAMMQVPPAQDTVVVRVPVPRNEAVSDTTVINIDVDMSPFGDSLASVIARVQADANAAIASASCGECNSSLAPTWFYAGVLTLGTLFLYRYWKNSPDDDDVIMIDDDEPFTPEPPQGSTWTISGGSGGTSTFGVPKPPRRPPCREDE